MRLLTRGNKERTQEPTAANKTSSRSHALLMVNVRQTAKSRMTEREAVKTGILYMIDLAGSERAAQTQVRRFRFQFSNKDISGSLTRPECRIAASG